MQQTGPHPTTLFKAIITGLIAYSLVAAAVALPAGPPHKPHVSGGGPDTVSAVVMYGDAKLTGTEGIPDDIVLERMLDSLKQVRPTPVALIRELRTLQRVRTMDLETATLLVDSLFDLDEVPYALINEISYHMSNLPGDAMELNAVDWYCDHSIPGTHIYGEWRTDSPNAYSPGLARGDSMLLVQLVRDELACGAHVAAHGVMSSKYGRRNGRPHNGIDIALRVGDPVYSIFPGVVRFAGSYGSFGKIVVVRHWNGLETYYAHLHRVKVTVGQEVDAGEAVGLGGNTGRSTGPHLHLEVRFKGYPIDPALVMDHTTGQLASDTLVLRKTRWSYAVSPLHTDPYAGRNGDLVHGIATR